MNVTIVNVTIVNATGGCKENEILLQGRGRGSDEEHENATENMDDGLGDVMTEVVVPDDIYTPICYFSFFSEGHILC